MSKKKKMLEILVVLKFIEDKVVIIKPVWAIELKIIKRLKFFWYKAKHEP